MSNKVITRDHNLAVLKNLGYRKINNTTVFTNGNNFILSPAVAKNKNGKYWFDIREVNLNRIKSTSLLLVRIVPNQFIFISIKSISTLLSKLVMDNRPNSGNVWSINIDLEKGPNTVFLYNIKKIENKIMTKLIILSDIREAFNTFKT